MLANMTDGVTNSRIPCALQNYLYKLDDQTSSAQPSLSRRELAFEHLVAYNSTTISRAISDKVDFVCPVALCLEHFETLYSCLQHLLNCPSISGASCWCPYCQVQENFSARRLSRDEGLESPPLRMSSRLRSAAMTLVQRLCRKYSEAAGTSLPPPNGTADIVEKDETDVPLARGSTNRWQLDAGHQPVEFSDKRQSMRCLFVPLSTEDAPQRGLIKDFQSNVKICDLLPRHSRIDWDSSDNVLTATELFEVLHEHVDVLNQFWMKKLSLRHGQDDRFSLSMPFEKGIQSLQEFYRGTLPRTFKDTFALMHIVVACAWIYYKYDETRFWHTFSLNILRWHYAIATEEDTQLFLEITFLLWSVPECSIAEAAGYSNNLWFQLHWNMPEIPNEPGNTGSLYFNHSQQSIPQAFDQSRKFSFISPIDLDKRDLTALRDVLSEDLVIGLCTRYLDDFHHTKIRARKVVETNRPSWKSEMPLATTPNMQTRIIDKLLQWDRVENFHRVVIEAQSDLQRGLLRNPREVEVQLAADGRSSNQPQSLYNEYRKLVCSLCNDAMLSSSSSWRNRFYATDLDEVLSTFYELENKKRVVNTLGGEENLLDRKMSLDEQQYEFSSKSSQSAHYTDSSTTDLTGSTFPSSLDPSKNNSNISLAPDSASSSSPVEFPSLTSQLSLYCPICSQPFKCKDQKKQSNLNRHIRSKHESHKLRCSGRGCGKEINRSDNLRRHCRKHHVDELDPCSASLAKKRNINDT